MSASHPLFEEAPYELYQKGLSDNPKFNVYQCKETGCFFTDLALNKQSFQAKEGQHSRWESVQGLEAYEVKDEMIHAINNEDTERYIQWLLQDGHGQNVLDIGPGTGDFLLSVQEHFEEAVGLEINDLAREKMSEKGLVTFSSWAEVKKQYDTMTLFHVFAEILEPCDFLEDCANSMKPDGRLLIETPNANNVLLKTFENEAFAKFHFTEKHPLIYSLAALEKIIEQSPFVIHKINYIQRYSLANNMYWLSHGKPGGQHHLPQLDEQTLNQAYISLLSQQGETDTIQLVLKKK